MERVVVDVSDFTSGAMRLVECGDRRFLLLNVGGVFHAVAERCSHAAVSLVDGRLDGCILECPMHGGKFDVRDGSAQALPARRAIATFPVVVEGGRAEISVE